MLARIIGVTSSLCVLALYARVCTLVCVCAICVLPKLQERKTLLQRWRARVCVFGGGVFVCVCGGGMVGGVTIAPSFFLILPEAA